MNIQNIVSMMLFGISAAMAATYSCLCTQYDLDDLATLLDIRDSLDPSGTVLTNWNSTYTCSNGFTGVYCDSYGKVNAIKLSGYNISGVLPSSIGDLLALQELNITSSSVSGPIPNTISNLVHLDTLILYNNFLNETIPDVFDTLTNLTTVDFGFNFLTGELPKSLGSLSKLNILDLGSNSLWGSIPEEIGSFTNLFSLNLRSNYFSGNVPSTLSCTNFFYLNLSLNCLTEPLDSTDSCQVLPLQSSSVCYSICDASQSGGSCAGHGTCTYSLSSYYCECDFGYASSTSSPFTCYPNSTSPPPVPNVAPPPVPNVAPPPVPNVAPSPPPLPLNPPPPFSTTLKQCNCQNFTSDDITVLLAIRPILDPYGLLTDWDPSVNCSNGWLGVYCDAARRVDYIYIDSVPLRGTIPPLLSNLRGLVGFSLHNTSLFGAIPGSLASLPKLSHIYLGYNSFAGPIPEEIFTMSNLQNLWIPHNRLTGAIPNGLSNLKKIVKISLSGNNLTGSIPTGIANLTTLRALWLDNNSFSGSIPAGIGNLPALTALDLSYNFFTGGLPSDIEAKCGQHSVYYFYYSCLTVSGNERCNFTTPQKDAFTCRPYCNGGQAAGACGGHGKCILQYSPFQASCDCDSGYGIVNDNFTCVATNGLASSLPPAAINFFPPPGRSSALYVVSRGGGMNYFFGAAVGLMIFFVIY